MVAILRKIQSRALPKKQVQHKTRSIECLPQKGLSNQPTPFFCSNSAFQRFLSNHIGLCRQVHMEQEKIHFSSHLRSRTNCTLFSQPTSHSRQGSNLDKFTILKVSDQIWSTAVPSLPSSYLSLSETTVTLPLPGRRTNWNIPIVSSI